MTSYINGTGVIDGVTFHQVDFMSLEGQTLQSLPLHYVDHSTLYNTTRIIPPAGFFYVKASSVEQRCYIIAAV